MRTLPLLLSASLVLAACGKMGTAQLLQGAPEDFLDAIVTEVTIDDSGCTPNEIVLEPDRKTGLRFMAFGAMRTVESDALAIHVAIPADEHLDVLIPTDRDGEFDLRCGTEGQTPLVGVIRVGD